MRKYENERAQSSYSIIFYSWHFLTVHKYFTDYNLCLMHASPLALPTLLYSINLNYSFSS